MPKVRYEWDDISDESIINAVDRYIHHERNRRIIKRRLLDGIRIEDLADEFDLSPRQIQNIVLKCEDTIFKHIP